MIAKKLETKIRDAILSASRSHASTTNLFSQDSTGLSTLQRPRKPGTQVRIRAFINTYTIVLLILDRNIDLVSVLTHGWTYQALLSDCLEFRLNRVTVAPPKETKKSYDLDSKDFFWAANAANPFPQVAEEIDAELNRYKADAAEITRSTGVSDVNDVTQLYALFFLPLIFGCKFLVQRSHGECSTSEDCHHSVAGIDSSKGDYRCSYEHCCCSA